MKKIIYFLFLIAIIGCYKTAGQSISLEPSEPRGPYGFIYDPDILLRPFQIVYAEQASRIGDSINLAPLHHLSVNDTVQLNDSSYLILAHYSGLFLEFKGDATLIISEISDSLIRDFNINPENVKFRTNVELLYSNKQSPKTCRATAARSYRLPIEFVLPQRRIELSKNFSELCVSWSSNIINVSDHTFNFRIKNIFDQQLDVIEVKGNKIDLNLSKYNNEQNLFVIKVEDKNNPEIQSSDFGIKVNEQYYYFPNSCNFDSALKAIEMGYHIESNHCYFEATEYYELASKLSDHKIFKELLNNHINRQ